MYLIDCTKFKKKKNKTQNKTQVSHAAQAGLEFLALSDPSSSACLQLGLQ